MTNSRNRILASLSDDSIRELAEVAEPIELRLKDALFEANKPITEVYFIETGVASIVAGENGARIEVATVGNEGMIGLAVFLGSDVIPLTAFIQVPGFGLRVSAEDFRAALGDRSNGLHDRLNSYTQHLFFQVAQSAACRSLHAVERRCARWLLMTHDRVDGDTYTLTQEFMAQMLGVRRATVTEAQSGLRDRGLIEYSRGYVTIKDRPGLEAASCECYRLISDELERLLGPENA